MLNLAVPRIVPVSVRATVRERPRPGTTWAASPRQPLGQPDVEDLDVIARGDHHDSGASGHDARKPFSMRGRRARGAILDSRRRGPSWAEAAPAKARARQVRALEQLATRSNGCSSTPTSKNRHQVVDADSCPAGAGLALEAAWRRSWSFAKRLGQHLDPRRHRSRAACRLRPVELAIPPAPRSSAHFVRTQSWFPGVIADGIRAAPLVHEGTREVSERQRLSPKKTKAPPPLRAREVAVRLRDAGF
jgi:hypothetical protein